MGKNSIDYFSKIASYLETEPLPDPSLACWDWLSIFFFSFKKILLKGYQFFQAMGQECGG